MTTWHTYLNTYLCNLNDVKDRKEGVSQNVTYDDDQLALFVEQASADMMRILECLPIRHTATLLIDWSRRFISRDSKTLNLYEIADLLAVTSITNGSGGAVASSRYVLEPANRAVKSRIALKHSNGTFWRPASSGNYKQVISITGTFGRVPTYPNDLKVIGQTLSGAISDSVTQFTASATTTLARGDYIRLDDETLFVSAVDGTTITVARGELGTTTASHDDGTSIQKHIIKNDIRIATAQYAQYLYSTKDRIGEDVVIFADSVEVPRPLAPYVKLAMQGNRKIRVTGLTNYGT